MTTGVPPLSIVVELDNIGALLGAHQDEIKAALRSGAMRGAQFALGLWIRGAQAALGQTSGAYIRALQSSGAIRVVDESKGGGKSEQNWGITIEIVNNSPHASIVEEGHVAFHLPSVVNWSGGRVKQGKGGVRYLHIPFGHRAFASGGAREAGGYTNAAVKAMMPEHIYAEAKGLGFTQRQHVGPVFGPSGQFQQADHYKQVFHAHDAGHGNAAGLKHRLDRSGTRPMFVMGGPGVSAGGPGEPGYEEHRGSRQVGKDSSGRDLINPAWKHSKFHGMMRGGTTGHASYTTIRTMTDSSLGWNIPAQRGHFIAAKVAAILQSDPRFSEVVSQGIAGDK